MGATIRALLGFAVFFLLALGWALRGCVSS